MTKRVQDVAVNFGSDETLGDLLFNASCEVGHETDLGGLLMVAQMEVDGQREHIARLYELLGDAAGVSGYLSEFHSGGQSHGL
jgi:hypothetical protein